MNDSTQERLKPELGARDKPGIVHLGLGAFFRAHGAIYFSELEHLQGEEKNAAGAQESGGEAPSASKENPGKNPRLGILGVSLMRPDQRDLLAPQNFAYHAVELAPEGRRAELITIIRDMLVAPEDPAALIAAMADPDIRIVTLTVTEKGYCHQPATGKLNRQHPFIIHDLESPLPRSAIGFLVRALARRREDGTPPFSVICCDNLPNNGPLVRNLVLELATAIDPELAAWIEKEGRFPATMVDRIVPATTQADIAALSAQTGVLDLSPVMHEPFRQWVVEDNFVAGTRPELERVGVQMVSDVTPFELMKLRCLNGTHSALAYLGYLAGHETIFDTVSDPAFDAYCRQLWRKEILPGLPAPEHTDLQAYTDQLMARYKNPRIRHLTWQIAMDGSQKLPQRILGTISDNLAAGRDSSGLILAVAGWMKYVSGVDEQGQPIDVRDPLRETLRAVIRQRRTTESQVDALLSITAVFPRELAQNPSFRDPLAQAFGMLEERGAQASVEEILY